MYRPAEKDSGESVNVCVKWGMVRSRVVGLVADLALTVKCHTLHKQSIHGATLAHLLLDVVCMAMRDLEGSRNTCASRQ